MEGVKTGPKGSSGDYRKRTEYSGEKALSVTDGTAQLQRCQRIQGIKLIHTEKQMHMCLMNWKKKIK